MAEAIYNLVKKDMSHQRIAHLLLHSYCMDLSFSPVKIWCFGWDANYKRLSKCKYKQLKCFDTGGESWVFSVGSAYHFISQLAEPKYGYFRE